MPPRKKRVTKKKKTTKKKPVNRVNNANNTQRVTVHVNSHNDGKGKSKEPTPYEFYSNYYNSLQPAAQPVPDYSNLFSQLAQSLQPKTQEKAAVINPYAAYDDYNATMMNYAPLTKQNLSNYNNGDRNDYVVPMPAKTSSEKAPSTRTANKTASEKAPSTKSSIKISPFGNSDAASSITSNSRNSIGESPFGDNGSSTGTYNSNDTYKLFMKNMNKTNSIMDNFDKPLSDNNSVKSKASSKKSTGSVKSKAKPEIPSAPSQDFLIKYNMLQKQIAENEMMGNEDIRTNWENMHHRISNKFKDPDWNRTVNDNIEDLKKVDNQQAEDIGTTERIKQKVKAKSKSKPDGAGGGGAAAAADDAVVVPGNKKTPAYMKLKGQLFEHPADSGNWYEKDEIEQLYYGGKKQKSGSRLRNYVNHGKIDPASKKEEVEAFVQQQNLFDKNQPPPTDINDVWGKQIQLINQRTNPTNKHYKEGHKKLKVYKFDD